MTEAGGKRGRGIGIDLDILSRTRHGDVGKARIDEVGVNADVDVHQNPVGGESLGAVAGDGIAMIEVPHLVGVERNGLAIVHADGKLSILTDALDGAEVTIGDAKLFVGRVKLQPVPDGKRPLDLAVGTDTVEPGCGHALGLGLDDRLRGFFNRNGRRILSICTSADLVLSARRNAKGAWWKRPITFRESVIPFGNNEPRHCG